MRRPKNHQDRVMELKSRLKAKTDVLSHYGKNGTLQCCWEGCTIVDVDMLTLDHIANDGAAHRKEKRRTGNWLYGWIRVNNYPDGFQTLCMNHQLKKEITRKRDSALKGSSL